MPPLLIGLVLVIVGMDNAEGESPLDSPRPFGQGKASRAEEFDRTGVLQPDSQITATLRPGIHSEFYYLIHHEGTPFTLLVSPCSGPISWTVSYTRPPENESDAEGANARWPVTKLVPGSPLFAYAGSEARNFSMTKAKEGVYRFEIKSTLTELATSAVNESTDNRHHGLDTVRLYATTESLDNLGNIDFGNGRGHRRHLLRFQQRRSKRRLGVSWSWSRVGPNLTEYCLAVTSGPREPPATLCAAQNQMQQTSTWFKRDHIETSGHHRRRSIPEGLHCPREPRLTLNGMRFNTTYRFALYAVSTTTNVSSRVTVESHKFRRNPTQTLRTDRPETANLRKNSGSVNFQYRPRSNTATIFLVRSCGGGSFRARLKGSGVILRDEEVDGHTLKLKAQPLEPGKRYVLRISATPQELQIVSTVKVVAREETASTYQKGPSKSRSRVNRFSGGSFWSKSSRRFKINRRPICSLSDI